MCHALVVRRAEHFYHRADPFLSLSFKLSIASSMKKPGLLVRAEAKPKRFLFFAIAHTK
jgi:hypothetical protein